METMKKFWMIMLSMLVFSAFTMYAEDSVAPENEEAKTTYDQLDTKEFNFIDKVGDRTKYSDINIYLFKVSKEEDSTFLIEVDYKVTIDNNSTSILSYAYSSRSYDKIQEWYTYYSTVYSNEDCDAREQVFGWELKEHLFFNPQDSQYTKTYSDKNDNGGTDTFILMGTAEFN